MIAIARELIRIARELVATRPEQYDSNGQLVRNSVMDFGDGKKGITIYARPTFIKDFAKLHDKRTEKDRKILNATWREGLREIKSQSFKRDVVRNMSDHLDDYLEIRGEMSFRTPFRIYLKEVGNGDYIALLAEKHDDGDTAKLHTTLDNLTKACMKKDSKGRPEYLSYPKQ